MIVLKWTRGGSNFFIGMWKSCDVIIFHLCPRNCYGYNCICLSQSSSMSFFLRCSFLYRVHRVFRRWWRYRNPTWLGVSSWAERLSGELGINVKKNFNYSYLYHSIKEQVRMDKRQGYPQDSERMAFDILFGVMSAQCWETIQDTVIKLQCPGIKMNRV